jgi:hypothetical protein
MGFNLQRRKSEARAKTTAMEELVFQLVSSFGAGLCGDDCGGDYHTDKGESD